MSSLKAAGFGHARDLQLGIAHADVWIESAAGRSDGVGRHRLGFAQAVFLRDRLSMRSLIASFSFCEVGPKIAAAGIGGVVAVASGRGTRMKIFLGGESLAEQLRAAHGSVFVHDQAAVGLVAKQRLRNAEDDQRIETTADDGQNDSDDRPRREFREEVLS